MKNNPLKNKFWELSPATTVPYIPDEQEIAEQMYLEELQEKCKHEYFNAEDGCPDCGYYAK